MKYFKSFNFWGLFFGLLFAVLLAIRVLNIDFSRLYKNDLSQNTNILEHESYMNLFKDKQKMGYSCAKISKQSDKYFFEYKMTMTVNTLGVNSTFNTLSSGLLNSDFTLFSFDFELSSGNFNFKSKGKVANNILKVQIENQAKDREQEIKLKDKIYLPSSITYLIKNLDLEKQKKFSFDVFDPSTMASHNINLEFMGKEKINNSDNKVYEANKFIIDFKGLKQKAWLDENNEVIREEGILGITSERTTKEEALLKPIAKNFQDLTQVVSIKSNIEIKEPAKVKLLQIELENIDFKDFKLNNFRQTLDKNVLTVIKEPENLDNLDIKDIKDIKELKEVNDFEKEFLKPSVFVQSDNEKIKELAKKITKETDTSLEKMKKIMKWINANIKKEPVISIFDAVSVLENKKGDCTEHAVLLAALARAAGVPADIELGIVYMKGNFFYHAWNVICLENKKWVSIDSALEQFPADATHIRLLNSSNQANFMGIIGKLKLKILKINY